MTHIGLNAHLLSRHAGYRSAGIHTYIHHLLDELPSAAPDNWHFTAMVGGANPATYDGITMQRAGWDTEAAARRILWEQLAQPRYLPRYDLYHAMAFAAPLVCPAPMVVTVYDLTFLRYPERLSAARRGYLQTLTTLTCRRARRVLAISESTGRDLTALLDVPPDKIDVTPLGYAADRFRPLPPDDIAAFKREKALPEAFWLFLGTLEPRKNLVTLIDAYAQLSPDERLPLILAGGNGWQTDDIFAAIKRHNLTNDISAVGFVPTDEIALWYNSAHTFIYPSVFEGFGLPVLEAMACGTPVITSDASSLPEVAAGAGICVPPHETAAWSAALRRAYHDDAWRQTAREAGLRKAQHFTWERTAQLTIASYERALRTPHSNIE